jgi:ribonuclease VapC
MIARFRIEIAPFTESQAYLSRQAFARFGKGRHPAGLNFGDCMAYALAKETGEELLFKGTDFGLTDVAVAVY